MTEAEPEPKFSKTTNGFTFFRLIFAFLVIFSHSFQIVLGGDQGDIVAGLMPFSLGTVGVFGFFGISGYLVSKSFIDRECSLIYFFIARLLRILPSLLLVTLIAAIFIGTIYSSLPYRDYFRHPEVCAYINQNSWGLFLDLKIKATLPGVFHDRPITYAVNDPIWTIPYEVLMYFLFAVIAKFVAILSNQISQYVFLVVVAVFFTLSVVGANPVFDLATRIYQFGLCFFLGVWLNFYDIQKIYKGKVIFLFLSGVTIAIGFHSFTTLFILIFVFSVIYISTSTTSFIYKLDKFGDASYGVYLYGFIIQQVLQPFVPKSLTGVYLNFILSAFIAYGIGVVSWHFFEKRILSKKESIYKYLVKRRLNFINFARNARRKLVEKE